MLEKLKLTGTENFCVEWGEYILASDHYSFLMWCSCSTFMGLLWQTFLAYLTTTKSVWGGYSRPPHWVGTTKVLQVTSYSTTFH